MVPPNLYETPLKLKAVFKTLANKGFSTSTDSWGVVILEKNKEDTFLNGGNDNTTNNRMELTAAIEALKYFEDRQTITLITDSKYVKDGIQSWIQNWKKNGWKTAAKKPVKNKELWIELDQLISRHTISWEWVKGHAGNTHNEKADYLARRYIEEA